MQSTYNRTLCWCITLIVLALISTAALASSPPMCPYVIGWNSTINTWVHGNPWAAPWVKVMFVSDIPSAQAAGSKVFYRPYDADNSTHDDGSLPSSMTGTQFADEVWSKISSLSQKPDVVAYRNEFNWGDASCQRTCDEFINYYNELRAKGYTGKIIFGSFGVGWVDAAVWQDSHLKAAVQKSDGIETHEYFDFTVACCSPYLCFRHRDLAIGSNSYLVGKPWYIGEFGSDAVCHNCTSCSDPQCRGGWNDRGKLTASAYETQMAAYRSACANEVVAVFVFAEGSSGWATYDVMGTGVDTWMQTTWSVATGSFTGNVKTTGGAGISGATVTTSPGAYTAQTSSSGSYTISNVPVGTYSVTATATNYAQSTQTNQAIISGAATTVNFTLSAITPGSFTGTVKSTGDTAISGATVSASPGGYTAQTNSTGAYTISNVPVGTYSLNASASGYISGALTGQTISSGLATTENFSLLPISPISYLKGLTNTSPAAATGTVVALFPTLSRIYIEDSKRISGIGIGTTTSVSLGDVVLAQGTMTTSDGEKILSAASLSTTQSGATLPSRVGMNNYALGGGAFGQQGAVVNGAGWLAGGANNVGLLVTIWGKVTYVDPAGTYFYLDDAGHMLDGSGHAGVRVSCSGMLVPSTGTTVTATGISGATVIGGNNARLLRPRSLSDIQFTPGTNYAGNPGFETGALTPWTTYGTFGGVVSSTWFGGIVGHGGTRFGGTATSGGTNNGGVYQRIAASTGSRYQATVWSCLYWGGGDSADSVQNRVGIDPTGGTNSAAGTVYWSSIDTQSLQYTWAWHQLVTPVVTCTGGYVTIFLDAQQSTAAGWHINCFDDAGVYLAQ